METARLWVRAEPARGAFEPPLLRLATREGRKIHHPEEEAEQRDALEQAYAAGLAEIARLRRQLSESTPTSPPESYQRAL